MFVSHERLKLYLNVWYMVDYNLLNIGRINWKISFDFNNFGQTYNFFANLAFCKYF